MILSEISNLLVLDELNVPNSENYVCFLSHMDSDFYVDNDYKSKIYTSKQIGNWLCSRTYSISSQYFNILQNKAEYKIHLSDGKILKAIMFIDKEPTGNVLFHFEVNHCTAIYLGHFRQIEKLMWDKDFIDLVSKGVDYLYIDNMNANSVNYSTEQDVGYRFKDFLKTHSKIILNTPEVGYEDLIKCFILDFGFKVYIHNDITRLVFYKTDYFDKFEKEQKDGEIVMIQDSESIQMINKRLVLKNFITVRLYDFQKHFENNTYEKKGLVQICYSSHISNMEMFTIIKLIQPVKIKEIYSEFPTIPHYIKSASKRWKRTNDRESEPIDENLVEIEDCAPKTKIISECIENFMEYGLSSDNQLSDKSENRSNSTDCEEVCIEWEKLSDKIKAAVHNMPKRIPTIPTRITVDSSPKRNETSKEEISNIYDKEHMSVSEHTSESQLNQNKSKVNKINEFSSLMHNDLNIYKYLQTETWDNPFRTLRSNVKKKFKDCKHNENSGEKMHNLKSSPLNNVSSYIDINANISEEDKSNPLTTLHSNVTKRFKNCKHNENSGEKMHNLRSSPLNNVSPHIDISANISDEIKSNRIFNKNSSPVKTKENAEKKTTQKLTYKKIKILAKDMLKMNTDEERESGTIKLLKSDRSKKRKIKNVSVKKMKMNFCNSSSKKNKAISYSLTENILNNYKTNEDGTKSNTTKSNKTNSQVSNTNNEDLNTKNVSEYFGNSIKEDAIIHENLEVIEILDDSPQERRKRKSGSKNEVVELRKPRKIRKTAAKKQLYLDEED